MRRNELVVTHPKHPGVEFVDVNTVHDVYVTDVKLSRCGLRDAGRRIQLVLDAMRWVTPRSRRSRLTRRTWTTTSRWR